MRRKLLDIKALQTLVAVAEEGSMTHAARRLNYSRSAISMQLNRLEGDLGVQLLHRNRGVVQPTRLGWIALRRARELLALNQTLCEELIENELKGTVRLGLPIDFIPMIKASWGRFASLFPGVEIRVQSELSVRLQTMLTNRELDLALLPVPSTEQRGELLLREPLSWIGSPGTRAHLQTPLPLAIGPEGGCEYRAAATACLDSLEIPWRCAYESQAFASLCAPVSLGLAVTVGVPSIIDPDLEIFSPKETGLPSLPSMDIQLCQAPGRLSAAAQSLFEIIKEDVAEV